MSEQEQRESLMEFEKNRQLLGSISAQRQQLSFQLEMISAAIDEMKLNKEKNVHKVVGNILFLKDAKEMEKELIDKKETIELKLKTIEKQEENIVKKLNSLKTKIEGNFEKEAKSKKN